MAREERVRFRYGICLNDSCSKCKSKEVQEIPARKELVCAECGKPLRECPPPKKGMDMKKIGIIAAAVLILGGGGAAIALSGGEEQPAEAPVEAVDSQKVDTPAVATPEAPEAPAPEAAKPEPKKADPAPAKPAPSAKNPSWGKYEGARNAEGKPHGNGILRITSTTTINGETAQPGETIEGVFRDGYVNMGTWYKKDGNAVVVKGIKVI
ncbi:MAG: hypothetical protein IJ081_03165 [Prevotella sp.]|jgi:hypothetical protein|nr:hypothetical protein [Prevotella sp.]